MTLFYIDPQSYNNLSMYDYSLLSPINNAHIVYYYNEQYQLPKLPGTEQFSIFNYSSKSGSLSKAWSYTKSIAYILNRAIKERPDVVHIQWIRLWFVDMLFACMLRCIGVKIVYTAHNILPHNPKRFDKCKFYMYYHIMSAVIVHTNNTKVQLVEHFNMKDSKINVIPHGILQNDVDDVAVLDMQKILQQQLSIKLSDIVFSCLGYQYAYKGVDLVADVWRNTPSLCNNPNAHLLMVGKNRNVDASVFDSIKDIPNVYIMDEQIDDVDFEAYMRISSVVLLPYKEISQSGLLFTAICAGVPTLVSNVGGLEDPLQYAQIGWSIGEPTYDNLLSVMTHLIDSPEEIQQVKDNKEAFRLVRSVYSWEKIAEKTSQLYMKLSGKNS